MKPGEPGSPGWTGRMDQVEAGAYDVAKVWAAYHRGMVDAGMTRDEATKVVCTWVASSHLSNSLAGKVLEALKVILDAK